MKPAPLLSTLLLLAYPWASPAEAVEKPAYLGSYVEPETGCRVTRISGDPGTPVPNLEKPAVWSDEVRHHYSLDQAWNADQTLLALDRNRNGCPNLLLDGRTFDVVSVLPSFPYESRWHPREPDLRIYLGGNELGYFNMRTQEKTVVATFDGYGQLSFANKGNVSDDGRMVAVFGRRADGRAVFFGYDLDRKFKHPDILPAPQLNATFAAHEGCTISPSGKFLVYNDGNDVRTVFDLEGNALNTTERAHPNHCDLGYDADGNEVLVGRSNMKPYEGRLITRRLSDGFVTVVNGPNGEKLGCGHVSTRNIHRPGWAYCSGVFYPPYEGWLIAVKLDGSGTVERLCRLVTKWKDYATEPHASPSWDGKRVIFCSNWEAPSGRPVQAYVVETR